MQTETDSLLEIPDFLRRPAPIMPEAIDSEAPCAAGQYLHHRRTHQNDARSRAWRMPDLSGIRAKKKERAARRALAAQKKAERRARKEQKRQDRESVLRAIEGGAETIGQIAKVIEIEPRRIKSALRWLMKGGAIQKASARRYAT